MLTLISDTFSQKTDQDLIRACLDESSSSKPDQAFRAFRSLVERYQSLVFNHIYRVSNQHDIAEEVTQEVFIKVYRGLRQFDAERPFKPWLFRIVQNELNQFFRRAKRQIETDAALAEPLTQYPDTRPTPEEAFISQATQEALLSTLYTLEPKYRSALLLRFIQDLSYEEIAEVLQSPINSVRTWLKRGKEKLYKKLQVL